MPKKIATFIKSLAVADRDGPPVTQRLYRMDPLHHGFEYVVSSATIAMFSGPETYLFGADKDGTITKWGELDGSFKGSLDHEQAIREAGYVVETET